MKETKQRNIKTAIMTFIVTLVGWVVLSEIPREVILKSIELIQNSLFLTFLFRFVVFMGIGIVVLTICEFLIDVLEDLEEKE